MNSLRYFGPTERQPADQPICPPSHSLMGSMEVIVPTEIDMSTLRTNIPEQSNTESMINDLDMVDELREAAVV